MIPNMSAIKIHVWNYLVLFTKIKGRNYINHDHFRNIKVYSRGWNQNWSGQVRSGSTAGSAGGHPFTEYIIIIVCSVYLRLTGNMLLWETCAYSRNQCLLSFEMTKDQRLTLVCPFSLSLFSFSFSFLSHIYADRYQEASANDLPIIVSKHPRLVLAEKDKMSRVDVNLSV